MPPAKERLREKTLPTAPTVAYVPPHRRSATLGILPLRTVKTPAPARNSKTPKPAAVIYFNCQQPSHIAREYLAPKQEVNELTFEEEIKEVEEEEYSSAESDESGNEDA